MELGVRGTSLTSPNGTQAVDRAAQLLIKVVHGTEPVTFTELTAASGLAKSTTSRLLMALERNGLVQRDSHGGFRPGEVFVSYAWRGGAEAGLITVAQPFLDRLRGGTSGNLNLGVGRRGRGAHPTRHTITSREALNAELEQVRRRGYAVTREELEPGLVAVAAPVYRDDGAVVAALSVSGPATRLAKSRIPAIAAACTAEARVLSGVLGHEPGAPARPPEPRRPPENDRPPERPA